MLAKLLDAFTIPAGRLTEVSGGEHWRRPSFGANTTGAKKLTASGEE